MVLFPRKFILGCLNKFLVMAVLKSKDADFLAVYPSINNLVIKIAVNKEVIIPINKVVANPLIGPEPNTNNMIAVKSCSNVSI